MVSVSVVVVVAVSNPLGVAGESGDGQLGVVDATVHRVKTRLDLLKRGDDLIRVDLTVLNLAGESIDGLRDALDLVVGLDRVIAERVAALTDLAQRLARA